MVTAFSTVPGFYAAVDSRHDSNVPKGKLRIMCARLESYDMDVGNEEEPALDSSFIILASMAEGKPEVARALLSLGRHIEGNREVLERFAKG